MDPEYVNVLCNVPGLVRLPGSDWQHAILETGNFICCVSQWLWFGRQTSAIWVGWRDKNTAL